eukprot:3173851-Lingulodinium_polyedra.AAC.1
MPVPVPVLRELLREVGGAYSAVVRGIVVPYISGGPSLPRLAREGVLLESAPPQGWAGVSGLRSCCRRPRRA